MSDIIRAVRRTFLPLPRDSQDTPAPSFANHYAAMNRMSEREQLQNQRNVARLTRTVKQSGVPQSPAPRMRSPTGGITQITGVVYGVTR